MRAVISLTIPGGFHLLTADTGNFEIENVLNTNLAVVLLAGYVLYLFYKIKTHPYFFRNEVGKDILKNNGERWSLARSLVTLLVASVMAAFMSEVLVGAAEETGKVLGMSSVFIGVVFLAIVGGAAESISAISMAAKNKIDLSIGIALGSSIQIALFIAPLLVILSNFVGHSPLNLTFPRALIVALFLSVILRNDNVIQLRYKMFLNPAKTGTLNR